MTERQRTVALLIDYDNLQICYTRDAPGVPLDLNAVVALAQSYGRLIVARAYAEWNLLSERLAVFKAGIEPAFAPIMRAEGSNRDGKSLADTVMVADGVDLIWSLQPDVLVLVTSDKDMIPLARLAKQRGVLVVVLGSDLTAVPLLEMANDFVTYRHLVRELSRPTERILARPEERLRGGRDATYSREVAAAREATQREPRTPPARGRPREPMTLLPPQPAAPQPVPALPTAPPRQVGPVGAPPEQPETARILEEVAQTVPARRRRRRGGRGRRTGLEADQAELTAEQEAAEAAEETAEAAEETAEAAEAERLAEAEAPTEPEAALPPAEAQPEPPLPEANVVRVDRARPRQRPELPRRETPVEPRRPAAPPTEQAEPRLRPWERFPETPAAPPVVVSTQRLPRSRPVPPPEQAPAPVEAAREPVAEPAPEAAPESAPAPAPTAEPVAAVEPSPVAAVTPPVEAEPTAPEVAAPSAGEAEAVAAEEPPTAEEAEGKQPARPRRRRTRRTPARAAETAE